MAGNSPLFLRPWEPGDEAAFTPRADFAAEMAAGGHDWSAGPPAGVVWTICRWHGEVVGVAFSGYAGSADSIGVRCLAAVVSHAPRLHHSAARHRQLPARVRQPAPRRRGGLWHHGHVLRERGNAGQVLHPATRLVVAVLRTCTGLTVRSGVVVTSLQPLGSTKRAGIELDDVITHIGKYQVQCSVALVVLTGARLALTARLRSAAASGSASRTPSRRSRQAPPARLHS